MRCSLVAGLLLGVAHLAPTLAGCAWLGLMMLGAAARRVRAGRAALAVLCAGVLQYAVALIWLPSAVQWAGHSVPASVLAACAVWALCGVLSRLPLFVLVLRVRPAWRAPLVGAAVWAGELIKAWTCEFPLGDVMYSQSTALLLRPLGLLGWHGTNLVWMTLLCMCGDWLTAPATRARAITVLLALLAALSSCPRPRIDRSSLQGMVAIQLPADPAWQTARPELTLPPGTELAVWPEGAYPELVATVEGHHRRERRLKRWGPHTPGIWHLVGLYGREREGLRNMTALLDPDGALAWVRAKSTTIPAGEGPWKGFPSLGDTFIPGTLSANLRIQARSVAALLCYEVYDRSHFNAATAAGVKVVALQSSDRPLRGSALAREQVLNAMRLRSAEFGVPIVRSSIGGEAALALPNGVLRRTHHVNTIAVLTAWEQR